MRTGRKLKFIACLMLIMTGLYSCSKSSYSAPQQPQTFVLVHGAWQAPFVWDSVKAQLTRAGQNVIVVQLPGHGTDTTSVGAITVERYRDQIISAISGVSGKVILVGHSLSGFAISAVEEQIPNQIDKLVFLAAYLPSSGASPLQLATSDKQTHVDSPALIVKMDQGILDFNRDSIAPIFCPDAPAATRALVVANFRPEPIIPFTQMVSVTTNNFGKADKYYIHTSQDEVIGINLQHQMAQTAGITKEYTLNSSHCPFLSMPANVTSTLLTIAGIKQ